MREQKEMRPSRVQIGLQKTQTHLAQLRTEPRLVPRYQEEEFELQILTKLLKQGRNIGFYLFESPSVSQFRNKSQAFPGGSVARNSPANARYMGSISGLGRSYGEGSGNPHQYSCLGNPMIRGAWQATVHGVTKESDTSY